MHRTVGLTVIRRKGQRYRPVAFLNNFLLGCTGGDATAGSHLCSWLLWQPREALERECERHQHGDHTPRGAAGSVPWQYKR